MRISEKIKHPFRRHPRTAEQVAARAEAEAAREQLITERGKADVATQITRNTIPPGF